jgi:hypothetical protein
MCGRDKTAAARHRAEHDTNCKYQGTAPAHILDPRWFKQFSFDDDDNPYALPPDIEIVG